MEQLIENEHLERFLGGMSKQDKLNQLFKEIALYTINEVKELISHIELGIFNGEFTLKSAKILKEEGINYNKTNKIIKGELNADLELFPKQETMNPVREYYIAINKLNEFYLFHYEIYLFAKTNDENLCAKK